MITDVSETRPAKRILTYGTYDLLHYGHVRLLKQAAGLGNHLVIGLSTDEFNKQKNKESYYPYEVRLELLQSIRYVDLVIPEQSWEQKRQDIYDHNIDILVMGSDWKGHSHFEALRDICEVVYFDYTLNISSTEIKNHLEDAFKVPFHTKLL